jgi:heat shock protein HslJ
MPRSSHARRGGRALAAAAGAALLLSACGGAPSGEPGDPPSPAGSWQLASGSGPEGTIEPLDTHPVTLSFEEEGRIGGTAACNSYGGEVSIDGDRLEVAELSQTEMACEPPSVMEVEAAYLGALARVDRFREEGDRLVLEGPDVELVFEPLSPVPSEALVGTAWELDTLVEGETASTPGAPGATLLLGHDGTLEGHTGCRALAGAYVLEGGEVRVTRLELEGDTAGCPDAAVAQDRLVASVLGDGFRAEVEGDRLTLTSRGGEGLGYRASGPGVGYG